MSWKGERFRHQQARMGIRTGDIQMFTKTCPCGIKYTTLDDKYAKYCKYCKTLISRSYEEDE